MPVLSVWRPPFAIRPEVAMLPEGLTLSEMAARMPGLPPDFAARGVICLAGHPVPRAAWGRVRPRPRLPGGVPVEVTFHAPPMGGGDGRGRGKAVLGLIASLALVGLGGAINAGRFATARGLFAAGSLSANALAAGVTLGGSLLISALTAPPALRPDDQRQRPNEGAASAAGNVLAPNAAIPRVVGERRVFPPLAAEPLTLFDGEDEVVEAVYVLAGPHRLSDIRIGAAPAASLPGVEIETREGWPGDPAVSMLRRQSRSETLQAELTGHNTDPSDGARLDPFLDPALAVPQPQVVTTRRAPDEHLLHLVLPQGLHFQGGATRMRVPFRLRMRRRGSDTWRNLPELHLQAASLRQVRLTVRLRWTGQPATPAAASEGWVEARRSSPDQSAAPFGGGWTADAAFGSGGDAWMAAGNLGTTGVQGVSLDRHTATLHLDPAAWEPGVWDIEITRGAAVDGAGWASAGYTVSGTVRALFGWHDPAAPRIAASRDGVADTVYLLRSVSLRDQRPVAQGRGLATIALRARNRALGEVSVLAGGWVPDWDGSAWADWAVTSNPAPHLRDILAGRISARPVPAALVDDAGLVAWRADCTAQGWRCNAILEDTSVAEAAQLVAGCGYARPRWSDSWGVVRDRDRSADVPVQMFTPRNSRGLRWTRALPDLPDGFRATFADATDDWRPRQIDVPRRGVTGPLVLPEQITVEGLDEEAAVRDRLQFDLAQAEARGTFYTLEAPAEAIVCQRGDLVAVAHDGLDEWQGAGRVVARHLDGSGDVTAVDLDGPVDQLFGPDWFDVPDVFALDDVFLAGAVTHALPRGPGGPGTAVALTGTSGASARLTFAVPQPGADWPEGALVATGLASREVLRLIVTDIAPREDLTATLTLVDEAPELHA